MRLHKERGTRIRRERFRLTGSKTHRPWRLLCNSLASSASALFRFCNREALRVTTFYRTGYLLVKLESIQVSSAPALHAKEPPDFEEALANVYLSASTIAWVAAAAAD